MPKIRQNKRPKGFFYPKEWFWVDLLKIIAISPVNLRLGSSLFYRFKAVHHRNGFNLRSFSYFYPT
jgi:hypothetical protein